MNNKIKSKSVLTHIIMLAFVLLSAFGLAGCSTADATSEADNTVYDNVVFIGVRQANQANYDYLDSDVSDIVYQTAYNYGSVCQISADGEPRFVIDAKFNEPDIHLDKQRKKIEAGNNRDLILEALPVGTAKAPECDLLGALSLAADRLHSEKGSGIIIIHNNGITTTGDLNFATADLVHADPEYIVKELESRHAIPDLKGIRVLFYGLGDVQSPQEELSTEYDHNLQAIWEAILNSSGADYYIDSAPYTAVSETDELPEVTPILVISESGIGEKGELPEVVRFDESNSAVRFEKGTDVFIDEKAAEEDLATIADYLLASVNHKIQVIGSTASVDDEAYCAALSRQRAQACADILIGLGVKPEQLSVTGIGNSPNPLRTNDLDSKGQLIESAAKYNRAVFFVRQA